jgi:hypothetical protein
VKHYLLGSCVLGAELPEKKPEPISVREVKSNYWTSVGAGLTVAAILAAMGFTYAKLHHKKFNLDNVFRGAA